jgi:hypothetical protein
MLEVAGRQFPPEACAAAVAGFAQQAVAAALHADLRTAVESSRLAASSRGMQAS